jgi:hypothetical protein
MAGSAEFSIVHSTHIFSNRKYPITFLRKMKGVRPSCIAISAGIDAPGQRLLQSPWPVVMLNGRAVSISMGALA